MCELIIHNREIIRVYARIVYIVRNVGGIFSPYGIAHVNDPWCRHHLNVYCTSSQNKQIKYDF